MSKIRLDLKATPTRPHFSPPPLRPPVTPPPRRTRDTFWGYLNLLASVPFIIVVLYLGSVLYNHERVVPRGVETVQDFYRRYGNPPRVDTLVNAGRTFYRIIGEIPAPLGFPKGNPIYIFDNTGRLVDWTGESNNDPSFVSRWNNGSAKDMSVAYFLEKFPEN